MKQIVRKAVKTAALKYLNEAKSGMSKLSNLKYEELKMQDYLVNENMSNRHKQLRRCGAGATPLPDWRTDTPGLQAHRTYTVRIQT